MFILQQPKLKNYSDVQFDGLHLQLVFNSTNTKKTDKEVLYVLTLNTKDGFISRNFIKSTAKDRCFFYGASCHYTSVYKSIVFGEAVQLCHLNKHKFDCLKSSVNLKDKCLQSNFNQKMTENMLKISKHWEDCFDLKSLLPNKNRNVWAMPLNKLLKLSDQVKKLKPKPMHISY